ncbi:hypothetical protein JCM10213_003369 [Rhodosporidiobolus nylandii]
MALLDWFRPAQPSPPPPRPPALPSPRLDTLDIPQLLPWTLLAHYLLPFLHLSISLPYLGDSALRSGDAMRWPYWLEFWWHAFDPLVWSTLKADDAADMAALETFRTFYRNQVSSGGDEAEVLALEDDIWMLECRIVERYLRLLAFDRARDQFYHLHKDAENCSVEAVIMAHLEAGILAPPLPDPELVVAGWPFAQDKEAFVPRPLPSSFPPPPPSSPPSSPSRRPIPLSVTSTYTLPETPAPSNETDDLFLAVFSQSRDPTDPLPPAIASLERANDMRDHRGRGGVASRAGVVDLARQDPFFVLNGGQAVEDPLLADNDDEDLATQPLIHDTGRSPLRTTITGGSATDAYSRSTARQSDFLRRRAGRMA